MKKYLILGIIVLTVLSTGCSQEQSKNSKTKLAPTEFSEKIKTVPTALLIDVRTPGEFSDGHLQNAINIDWIGDNFDSQIATLDKSTPILVYCLSGKRSAAAASKMRGDGFKEVYEMQGGITNWKNSGLPVVAGN